ncbi:dihydrofolate reductase [Entomortierella parvispora]|uniref:Dihydrofolate reductase n=1 Tax=Entomortierella parvispora TaxID=205924 RepID=A0A9P3HI34_9FUNG|nr:dihydrofolate reductase [Entomortierella parvispora]
MSLRSFAIVVAADLANGIGLNGTLPWRLRKDMAFFAKLTSKTSASSPPSAINACIMGRKTWESIPQKFRPLTSRLNIIVSRDPHYLDDKPEKSNPHVRLASSLEAALSLAESLHYSVPSAPADQTQVDHIYLIGGAQLYNEGVLSKDCKHIYLTRVHATVECDTFFPEIKESEYTLLPSQQGHKHLEELLQEPVEGGLITEGSFQYEYTVYERK